MNLLDVFRCFPGGVIALARETGLPLHTLYRLGHGVHRKRPMRTLDIVARVLSRKPVRGKRYSPNALLVLWAEAHEAHMALAS